MVQNFEKVLCILIYLGIQTHFPPKFKDWFVAWRSQSNYMDLWQNNRLKSNRFSFLNRNPDCTKVPIPDFGTDFTESSNLFFWLATGLDSAIKISIKIPTIVEEDSIESFFNSWNKILELWKRTEVSLFQKPQLWKSCFSASGGLIFSIKVSIRSFWLLANLQVEKLSRFFLAMKPDAPKIPKAAISFDLTRCSNSILSKFTCLIRSITIPSDLFGVVTNQSNKK